MVDGATVTMADSEKNQAAYPQLKSQRKGLGFPMMRVVALMCLASGALPDAVTGACAGKGGDEQTLVQETLERRTGSESRSLDAAQRDGARELAETLVPASW